MSWWGEKQDAAAREGHPVPSLRVPGNGRFLFGGALGLLVTSLLLLAPVAFAAAPPNDDFADAQVLNPGLPVEAAGTTLGATAEVGEPSPDSPSFTGRTVWFQWEATSTGFVTVSTCGSQIDNVLGVYTGAAVDALTEVAGDFSSRGPECSAFHGTAVTFKAVSGVTYGILVEGRQFFPEEAGPGEGPFVLKVAATPLPPNDDFADATVLSGQVHENRVYTAGATGFSWNATKEAGEPEHAGNPGGASVWYSWTAPFSDTVNLTGCGRSKKTLLGVYTGNSVDSLTQVVADNRSCGFVLFPANAGTTYRIAVDGEYDSGSGAAAMGSLSVNLYRSPPALPEPPHAERIIELVDTSPPNATIRKRTLKPAMRRVTFAFRSSERGSSFRCNLDRHGFVACNSPRAYRGLRPGGHVFEVVAVDTYANTDPTPAVAHFKIPKPNRHKG